ncbi:MAG: HGGxSTG domain-containing protein, partial [Rhodospirillales bacterium]
TLLCLDCVACLDHLEFNFPPKRVKVLKVFKTSKASIAPIERSCSPCRSDHYGEASVQEVLWVIPPYASPLPPNRMEQMSRNLTMLTAGGRICCKQCQAMSKRTRRQCKAPAIRGKNVCRTHGGLSTGPKTEQGRQRCAEAKTVHGNETREIRAERGRKSAELHRLVDLGNAIGLFNGAVALRGRRPG